MRCDDLTAGVRFGSVCSGIEAASVAFGSLGWRAAWLSEVEPFPCAVLAHHYPDVANLGDMTTIARRVFTGEVEAPDVLCGGTPCQAFSVAGLRESLSDERGNLTLKFVELADAIDFVRGRRGDQPAIVFWENVPGVLSTKDNAFGCFLAGLAGEDEPLQPPGEKWGNAGAVYGPTRAIAWRTLDAQYFGLAQRRRRVFVVASARSDFDPATILFEWEGLRRDSPPSREAGEEITHPVAQCLTSSGRGIERTGDTRGQDPVVTVHPVNGGAVRRVAGCWWDGGQVSQTLDAVLYKGQTMPEKNRFPAVLVPPEVPTGVLGAVCHALTAEGFDASEDGTGRGTPVIAFPANLSATQCASAADLAPSLCATNPTAIATPWQVRRLTPRECERLQGFPDDYTKIPWRNKPASECPDGPRYKAIGNSWAINCVRWIGRRIDSAIKASHENMEAA